MSLSKREDTRYRFPQRREVRFPVEKLAAVMQARLDFVEFAYLVGSGADGVIPRYSDLDVAVYLKPGTKKTFDLINEIMVVVEGAVAGPVDVDVAILNDAGPVFRFQALRGRRLFVRPAAMDEYATFYSLTCREYEDYMFSLKRYYRDRRQLRDEQAAA